MSRILKGGGTAKIVDISGSLRSFDAPLAPVEEKHPIPMGEKIPPAEEVVLSEAVKKAEALLAQARSESAKIRDEAYEKGFEEGVQEGVEAGRQDAYEAQMQAFQQEIHLLEEKIGQYVADMCIEKEKILEQYLDDLKNISLAIGEKIVQTSLKSSSEVVKKMILAATEKLKKTTWAKIYVARTNEEMDIQGDAQLISSLAKISDNVKIIVMEDAEPGSCIIELPQEIIDISVSTQMENIREILNNARL